MLTENQTNFMNEYYSTSEPGALYASSRSLTEYNYHRIIHQTYIMCCPNNTGGMHLGYISSWQPKEGTKALRHILNLADKHNVIIEGNILPHPDDPRVTKERLKKWYKRYGGIFDGDKVVRHPNINR